MSRDVLEALSQNPSDVLRRVLGCAFIVEMGIIKEIQEDGRVTVEMSASTKAEDIVITNCVLANIASSSVTVSVKPNIDDKVIVLFPRRYSSRMFSPEQNETIVSSGVSSYSVAGGIAVLMNVFQADYHKNYISIEDGCLTVKLAYSEDDEENLFSLTTTADGAITLNSNDTTVSIDNENAMTIDTGKAQVSIDKDGNVLINAMDGKLSIKNNQADLFTILNGMLTTLNSTLSTSGSPAKHIVDPQQFQQQATDLGNLMQ